MTTTTNNTVTKTEAHELTEALGNTIAFGDHLKRVATGHALNLEGYDEETAKEIRQMMFEDELANECPAYAEGFEFNEELGGYIDVLDEALGTEHHKHNASDFDGDLIGWGSASSTQMVIDNLQKFVAPLACWKKSAVKNEEGKVISKGGFDAEKFERHQAKALKERTYHDISEIIFDKAGRVKSLNGDKKPRRQRVARRNPRK